MKKIWEREMWMVLGFLAGCFALGLAWRNSVCQPCISLAKRAEPDAGAVCTDTD